MGRPRIELWQGMARYFNSNDLKKRVSQEAFALGETVATYKMKTIEDWKINKIPQFTMSLPGTPDKIALCRETKDVSGLKKVASIYRVQKTTYIEFYKICEDLKELASGEAPIGYLAITSQKGNVTAYELRIESVPRQEGPNGVVAFVDGSGGGRETVSQGGVTYRLYGGAYLLFEPGNPKPIATSCQEEYPIRDGLQGISEQVGNVYGEINSAIMAIRRADKLGYERLRLYYDCEQIGGHAPGGAYAKHDTAITKKYVKFLDTYEFSSLETIELVHVDAHVEFQQNNQVDKEAREARDKVAVEFAEDSQKQALYLEHARDYD